MNAFSSWIPTDHGRGRLERSLVAGLLLICAVGCGGENAPSSTAGTPSSTAVTTGTTSPTSVSTALTALQPFFAAAQRMDGQLRAAGARINGTVGPSTITMDPTIIDAVMAIDDRAVAQRVPGGLDDDLLRAVLTVYDDLSVRRASLGGYGHFFGKATRDSREGQDLLRCLSYGADPAAHFADDLARAKTLASARSVTVATPGSRASAEVAVRLAWLRLGNVGCGACGAPVHRPVALSRIRWHNTPAPVGPPYNGDIDGTLFRATYQGSTGWDVAFNVC